MEEHHHNNYEMPTDLRHFINTATRSLFITPTPPQHPEFLLSPPPRHRRDLSNPPLSHHHYDMAVMPPPPSFHRELLAEAATATSAGVFGGLEMDAAGAGNGRWPRQETLTLLEIRSRLDSKFKEANQKGPLWDEVSRIMGEEHGYQRSGKKCREKFENLYKYYKKTKDGKGGRQDGKHYRFFRQLEALYGGGETSTTSISDTQPNYEDDKTLITTVNDNNTAGALSADSLSLSNSSDYDTSSDDIIDQEDETGKRRRRKGKGRWRGKIKEFIDGEMRKLMEKQEAWLEKIMKTLEKKEQERVAREEDWRRREAARLEAEQAFWAHERAWIQARDSALMEALHKACSLADDTWSEDEVSKLVQIRTNMGPTFDENHPSSHDALWDDIAAKMSYLGFDRSGPMCRDKWLQVSNYYLMNKKRKECNNNLGDDSCYYVGPDGGPMEQQQKDISVESCFRLLMGEHCENVWDNYGLKLSERTN